MIKKAIIYKKIASIANPTTTQAMVTDPDDDEQQLHQHVQYMQETNNSNSNNSYAVTS